MIGFLDSQIIEKFKEFQERTGKYPGLNIATVEFKDSYPFNDDANVILIGSKHIANHEELDKINDTNGIPVYDASANINTYVDENKFSSQVFEVEDNNNPDISFASEGNSSAGTNFIIHNDKYFVNNHRTVMKFKNKYYSKYVYYNIFKMKEKYNFRRGYTPSQKELKKLKIMIPIPKDYNEEYKSFDIQKAIVSFLEYNFENLENLKNSIVNKIDIISRMKRSLIPSTFKKTAIKNRFKKYSQENNIDFEITEIEFNEFEYTFGDIFDFNGGVSVYKKPYYKNPNNAGDYPLFTGSTIANESVKPIDKNHIVSAPAISYNKDNDKGSVAFYHSKAFISGGHHYSLKVKKDFLNTIDLKYSYYLLSEHFLKNMYFQSKEPRANSSVIKNVKYFLPIPMGKHDSLSIQQILAKFIETIENELEKNYLKKMNECLIVIEKYKETYLKRSFNKIIWS